MSTNILEQGSLIVTKYTGPGGQPCYQINDHKGRFVQLTMEQGSLVVSAISADATSEAPEPIGKQGIDLVLDHLEALRVRIDQAVAPSHWALLCKEALVEAVKIEHMVDRVTAALGLPKTTSPDDIALAVRQCTRRCEELEHRVSALQDSHR